MAEETAAVTRKIDWETIKSEYVTTNISQKTLAEKYGISKNAVQYRCAVERWESSAGSIATALWKRHPSVFPMRRQSVWCS